MADVTPSGAGENFFRNIRDRIGKQRLNRSEIMIAQGFIEYADEMDQIIKGIIPTRLGWLSAEVGGDEVELTPDFHPQQHYYIIHVPNDVTAITLITEMAGGGTATGDGEKTELTVGTNAFTITTSSNERPDGYYKIIVARAE